MSAALECWSSRASADEETVEQVLMRNNERSEENNSSDLRAESALQKRLQRLGRNVSEAIASFKNSLNLDSAREPQTGRRNLWGNVVRQQLYCGTQLPEKLVSDLQKHYESLPNSYSQAAFEMKDVLLHMKLIEQTLTECDDPAIMIHEMCGDDDEVVNRNAVSMFKLTFASNSMFSWSLDSSSTICCKNLQIFEKKGFTLGIVLLLVQTDEEKSFKTQIESWLKMALKKPKNNNHMKLSFGLCGCQEKKDCVDDDSKNSGSKTQDLKLPLPDVSIIISVDEWHTLIHSQYGIGKWLLNHDTVDITDQIGPNRFKGVYKGKKVWIEKLKGNSFELRRDLLELMNCGHKNILQFYGVFLEDNHRLCTVMKMMGRGSVHELIMKNKKIQMKEIVRILTDVAEGIKFMNDHGVAYTDLNTHRILLDKQGNSCIGDMGIVTPCKSTVGEAMEYETDGYRWLAPEIISCDPENVTETVLSNVYSFGMIIWEMVSGEIAYSSYSPVQAAVGIAACGLRPEIPVSCPQTLRTLMLKCWNNCPHKRPTFAEIISILTQSTNN